MIIRKNQEEQFLWMFQVKHLFLQKEILQKLKFQQIKLQPQVIHQPKFKNYRPFQSNLLRLELHQLKQPMICSTNSAVKHMRMKKAILSIELQEDLSSSMKDKITDS